MRQTTARDRRYKGLRPGGEHQLIPPHQSFIGAQHPRRALHRQDPLPAQHRNAALLIPGLIVQPDGGRLFLASQHWRQLYTVVGWHLFVTDDGYRVATGRKVSQRLNQPRCRQPISNDDQAHGGAPQAAFGCFS